MFGLLAALVRSDLSKDAELLVLRRENQVLRRQLSGGLRWDNADRLWLAALSRLVIRRRWPEVFRSHRPRSCTGTVISSPASRTAPAGAAGATAYRNLSQGDGRSDGAGEPCGVPEVCASSALQ